MGPLECRVLANGREATLRHSNSVQTSTPSRIWIARAVCLPLQLFSVGFLHVQSARRGLRAIVNFDPATANVASCNSAEPRPCAFPSSGLRWPVPLERV